MNNLGMARPDMFRGAGMCPPDFKPPSETQAPAPPNPKKRRKTANNSSVAIQPTPPPTPADLLPPTPTGYGDTIVASNPFDDAPPASMNMGHFGMNHHQMNPHMMGHPPAMRGMNPMMNAMPGMPGHHMNNRGLSPMGNMNPNLSPMGMGGMNQMSNHAMNQIGPMQPNSPNALNSPQMRPPMHSPLSNGPGNPNNRMNGGQMNPSQHSPHPQMGNLNSPNNTSGPAQNNINNIPGNNGPNSMPVSSSGGPAATGQMNMMSPVNSGPNQGGMYGGPKPMPVSAGKVILFHNL